MAVFLLRKQFVNPPQNRRMVVFLLGKQFVGSPASVDEWRFSLRKQFVRLQTKSLAPQKIMRPYDILSKTSSQKGKMVKFLYYRQMVSYLQVLVRSLMRKRTLEVSLLPSNGILPPSAGKKFDEETTL